MTPDDLRAIAPEVEDIENVGSYPAAVGAGGGYVWDAVLEYRVWCHPERGSPDLADGNDYYYPFGSFDDALDYSVSSDGAELPLALVLQREFIEESEPGQYVHVREERLTEWPVQFLSRPRRTPRTLPEFFSADAPDNRLDIIRGEG